MNRSSVQRRGPFFVPAKTGDGGGPPEIPMSTWPSASLLCLKHAQAHSAAISIWDAATTVNRGIRPCARATDPPS